MHLTESAACRLIDSLGKLQGGFTKGSMDNKRWFINPSSPTSMSRLQPMTEDYRHVECLTCRHWH